MNNDNENSRKLWEKLFGKGTWLYLLIASILLLTLAFKGFETFLSESVAYLIGFLGFVLCFVAIGIGIQYLSSTLIGEREEELISGETKPESFLSSSLTALLMLVIGSIFMVLAWVTSETILAKEASILIGVVGFFLAFFSLHQFAQGLLVAIFRPLWKMEWFKYLATLLLLIFAGLVLYNAYLSLQD